MAAVRFRLVMDLRCVDMFCARRSSLAGQSNSLASRLNTFTTFLFLSYFIANFTWASSFYENRSIISYSTPASSLILWSVFLKKYLGMPVAVPSIPSLFLTLLSEHATFPHSLGSPSVFQPVGKLPLASRTPWAERAVVQTYLQLLARPPEFC